MKCVLITGGTGVIGSELVPLFLASNDVRIRLIVRAESPEHLQERMKGLFAYWQIDPGNAIVSRRLEAIAGDLCRPGLGTDDTTYCRLAREVTHVVHCAGEVKLNQTMEHALRNAVDPARHLVQLARACQRNGQFQKFDAVTTIGVAGRMPGEIPERPLTEPRRFHNNYEAAKAEAEKFLFGELAQGLPLTIHRPSMVVGRSDTGRVRRFQVFYHLCEFLSGRRTWGYIVDTGDKKLDIVPVDYVARMIHLASGDHATVGRIFHLCSGDRRSIRLDHLAEHLRATAADRRDRRLRPRTISSALFRCLLPLAACVSRAKSRRALRTLPYFLAYLNETQSFGTNATDRYFRKVDLVMSEAIDYLDVLLGFYRSGGCPSHSPK